MTAIIDELAIHNTRETHTRPNLVDHRASVQNPGYYSLEEGNTSGGSWFHDGKKYLVQSMFFNTK